jgi:hypothetical protein
MKLKVTDHPKHVKWNWWHWSLLTTGNVHDKSALHVSGWISHYNCRILGLQLHEFFEYGCYTQKVNIYGPQHDHMVRFFFCGKNRYWGHSPISVGTVLFHPPRRQHWNKKSILCFFQQDGTLPHVYMFALFCMLGFQISELEDVNQ